MASDDDGHDGGDDGEERGSAPAPRRELSEPEREALHELQLGLESIYRGYGALLDCHHHVGGGMDHLDDAEELLREAGREEFADALRDEHLPAGVIGDRWTYELVDEFRAGFLARITDFERDVREELADGTTHVTERRQQAAWRERASGWEPEAPLEEESESGSQSQSQSQSKARSGRSDASADEES